MVNKGASDGAKLYVPGTAGYLSKEGRHMDAHDTAV